MLTDLSFLSPGAAWPPTSEVERLQGYEANRKMFEADHADVFMEALKRVLRSAQEVGLAVPTSYELCVNYPRLISTATAGLLFNRSPGIVVGDEGDKAAMDAFAQIADRSELPNILYSAGIDVSRYGAALLYVYKQQDGGAVIDLSRPDLWFPVVDAANIRRVLYHVLATPYEVRADGEKKRFLRVEIHGKGSVEIRDYRMESSALGALLSTRTMSTGLDDFAIIPVHNIRPSDRVFGISDYEDIQSLVCELEVRLGQISKVLDRHTDPTMQGPESALEDVEIEPGKYTRVFVPGKYFVNQNGAIQGNIEYLTWDAQLAANFSYIEKLLDFIRIISEMGALLSDMKDMGSVPSGAAMRRMLYPAIAKISRIRNSFTPAIKKAVALACALDGIRMAGKPVYIDWPDTLPRDPQEMAQIASIRTGGKQTQSVKRALMDLDELSEDEAEKELESIQDEQTESMPMIDTPNNDDTDDEREGV